MECLWYDKIIAGWTESMVRIGFLGPKGTFSQEAVKYYLENMIGNSVNDMGNIDKINGSISRISSTSSTRSTRSISSTNSKSGVSSMSCISCISSMSTSIKNSINNTGMNSENISKNISVKTNENINKNINENFNENISTTNDKNEKKSKNIIEKPFNSISDMFFSIKKGEINEAIVPIENSIEGAVNETLDLLASDMDLSIKGEVIIPIRQNLLVREGTYIDNIEYILSHPQPVGQCRGFITSKLPNTEIKLVYSTARAAEIVSGGEYGLKAAAIGSFIAAEVYGLKILAENIQDNDNNFTRFVIISDKDSERTGNDKTSLVFSTEDKPGSLYRILEIFNLWDINMTRIESRPAKKQLGQYIFFVDIEGHREDEDVRDALMMVKRKTSFFRLLGSYPSQNHGE